MRLALTLIETVVVLAVVGGAIALSTVVLAPTIAAQFEGLAASMDKLVKLTLSNL